MVKETEACSVSAIIQWLTFCFYLISIVLFYSTQTDVRYVKVQNPSIHKRMPVFFIPKQLSHHTLPL
jgi:hypothetical protein